METWPPVLEGLMLNEVNGGFCDARFEPGPLRREAMCQSSPFPMRTGLLSLPYLPSLALRSPDSPGLTGDVWLKAEPAGYRPDLQLANPSVWATGSGRWRPLAAGVGPEPVCHFRPSSKRRFSFMEKMVVPSR